MKKIKETIEITEEFTVPGTEVIIEKGDKIKVLNESTFDSSALSELTRAMLKMAIEINTIVIKSDMT